MSHYRYPKIDWDAMSAPPLAVDHPLTPPQSVLVANRPGIHPSPCVCKKCMSDPGSAGQHMADYLKQRAIEERGI